MGVIVSHDHLIIFLIFSLDIQFSIAAKRKPLTLTQNVVTVVSVYIKASRYFNHFAIVN